MKLSHCFNIEFVSWNSGYTILSHLCDVRTKEVFSPSQLDCRYQTSIDAARWRFSVSEKSDVEGLYGCISKKCFITAKIMTQSNWSC
jgi:hypothetical protein